MRGFLDETKRKYIYIRYIYRLEQRENMQFCLVERLYEFRRNTTSMFLKCFKHVPDAHFPKLEAETPIQANLPLTPIMLNLQLVISWACRIRPQSTAGSRKAFQWQRIPSKIGSAPTWAMHRICFS